MKSMRFLFVTLLLLLFIDGGLKAQTVEETVTRNLNFPIRCDFVTIDRLIGTAVIHLMTHYDKDGKIDWIKNDWEAFNMISVLTREKFEVSFHQKQSGIPINENLIEVTVHYNCVGDMGSHYIISETFQDDFTTTPCTRTFIKQECKCW